MFEQAHWSWRKSIVFSGIVSLPVVVLLAIMIEVAPGDNHAEGRKWIRLLGCPEFGPLFQQYEAYYAKRHRDTELWWSVGTNRMAASALRRKEAPIIGMTRPLTKEEFEDCVDEGLVPTSHLVASEGLAILVHASNPVKEITVEQVVGICGGRIGNWKELGGPDAQIHRLALDMGREESRAFYDNFLAGRDLTETMEGELIHEREALIERLRQLPLGIGYVRAQMVFQTKRLPKEVKLLKVNGVALTKDSIRSGNYPLVWPVLFYTNGYPAWGSDLHRLVTLHLSKEGQSLIEAAGYCPVTEYK